ncbi:DUF4157 domain-containing protein (plasmid) [Haloferax sp. S1W]|uniref:DUF4157 domain-containing protein n=1 Tax=Haloferax sp. S1W TaxID=3377110 RepID=UPI0037C99C76
MGFRSAKEKTSEGEQSSVVPSIQELTGGSDRSRGGGGRSLTPQDYESRFGLEAYRPGMDVQIQRLVQSHGASQVRQWADEGMTVDTMGKPRDMRQFRERQDERPAEVPKDIERRNAKSVQRSRNAHHEASKAGDAQVPDSVRDVISSPGQHLDTSIQRAMEDRMGDNLGDVRIHTGPTAAKACEDINARAFTVGNHIAFNHGEYDPSSAEGQHVLAHELAHVRQQTGGAVSMLPQEGELEIDPDERLEREAEETAERVMRGGKLGIHRMRNSEVHVQRMPDAEKLEQVQNANARPTVESLANRVSELETKVSSVQNAISDMTGGEAATESLVAGVTDAAKTSAGTVATSLIAGGSAAAGGVSLGTAALIAGGVGLGVHGLENLGRAYGDDAIRGAKQGAKAAKDRFTALGEQIQDGYGSIKERLSNISIFSSDETGTTEPRDL